MRNKEKPDWSRREFLRDVSVAGAAALFGFSTDAFAAEPAPETTKLRLIRSAPVCTAPQYIAEELLRGEGFSDIQEIRKEG
jgi:NitT/TauT family transport system substrate-binding protein